MEQVNSNRYRVRPQEQVTVIITGVGVGNSFAVFDGGDGTTGDPLAGIYDFTISRPPGKRQTGRMEATFPPGAPTTAHFTTLLRGSAGGGSFPGPTIAKSDHLHFAGSTFEVV